MLLIIIIITNIVSTTYADHIICESIRNNTDNNDDDTFNIFNVGVTKTKILLITKQFFLFEIDIDSLNAYNDKLYLNAQPQSISKKYPYLWNYKRFQDIKDNIVDIRIFIDDEGEWLCFIPLLDYGIGYNLETGEIVELTWFVKVNVADEKSIGTNETYRNYVFRYRQSTNNNTKGIQLNKDTLMDRKVRNSKRVELMYIWANLCLYSENEIFITTYPCHKIGCETIDWGIQGGFVVKERFYLLGKDDVYSFPEKAYTNWTHRYRFDKQQYRSFIR
ncbi:hypothetical protein BLA29_007599, partial [Euroglyphus maynei]